MERNGFKVQNTPVLFLFLIVVFSCKNEKVNKTRLTQADTVKTVNEIAASGRKDNYILDETSSRENGLVYMYCETMPEFPGGEKAFKDFMMSKIVYPAAAVSDKREGRVVLKFVITKTGQKSDIQIVRSIRPDMDKECVDAVNAMPQWKPGMIDGKPVSVSFNITIRFLLKSSGNLNGIYILPSKI